MQQLMSAEDRDALSEQGVVLLRGLLDTELVACWRAAVDEMERDPGRFRHSPESSAFRYNAARERGMQTIYYIDPHLLSPELSAATDNPSLREIAATVLGSSRVRLLHDRLIIKPANASGLIGWHQDAADVARCLPMWIPLTRIEQDHGGPEYIQGSHLWERSHRPDDGEPRHVPSVQPGDVVVHDRLTWHRSDRNLGPSFRIALLIVLGIEL